MKSDTHPKNHRPVIFRDLTSGMEFLVWSTVDTKETGVFDGVEYPVYAVEISSASHPFYTGAATSIDKPGRVERFRQRQAQAKK